MDEQRPVRIVAAIDLESSSQVTLQTAAHLAGANGQITLVHVATGERQVRRAAESALDRMQEDEERLCAFVAGELGGPSHPLWQRIDAIVCAGDTTEQIVQVAIDVEADFVVVGSNERRGLERVALGSVSTAVSRRAPCSVVVARVADRERPATATVDAPLATGEQPMRRTPLVAGARRRRFAIHDSNVIPTGIRPQDVR